MRGFDKKMIVTMIVFLITCVLLLNYYLRETYGGYSLLDRCQTHNITVNDVRDYKGVVYINDSIKLSTSYKNDTPPPVFMLYEFIQKGDSITLEAKSDTLFLFRGNEKHWFIYFGEPCDE